MFSNLYFVFLYSFTTLHLHFLSLDLSISLLSSSCTFLFISYLTLPLFILPSIPFLHSLSPLPSPPPPFSSPFPLPLSPLPLSLQVNAHSALLSSMALKATVWSSSLYGALVGFQRFLKAQCRDWLRNAVNLATYRSVCVLCVCALCVCVSCVYESERLCMCVCKRESACGCVCMYVCGGLRAYLSTHMFRTHSTCHDYLFLLVLLPSRVPICFITFIKGLR